MTSAVRFTPSVGAHPFFAQLPLDRYGLGWIEPPVQVAHPLDDGAALLLRDLEATAHRLGPDAGAYLDLVGPAVRDWDVIINDLTGPFPHSDPSAEAGGRHQVRLSSSSVTHPARPPVQDTGRAGPSRRLRWRTRCSPSRSRSLARSV
jgi:phytoene dehydrogenase-like protein